MGVAGQEGTYVLLVEDDADLGSILEEVVSSRGYRTCLCVNGKQALASLARERPSLVILDWGLPDADPEELAASFTAVGVPVVLASGGEHTAELSQRIGACAKLDKPYAIDDVFALLERLLGPAPLSGAYS
jgi:DNA-binding response OmpR family regulator